MNIRSFAEGIAEFIDNPAKRRKHSYLARTRAKKFTPSKTVEKLFEILEESK